MICLFPDDVEKLSAAAGVATVTEDLTDLLVVVGREK